MQVNNNGCGGDDDDDDDQITGGNSTDNNIVNNMTITIETSKDMNKNNVNKNNTEVEQQKQRQQSEDHDLLQLHLSHSLSQTQSESSCNVPNASTGHSLSLGEKLNDTTATDGTSTAADDDDDNDDDEQQQEEYKQPKHNITTNNTNNDNSIIMNNYYKEDEDNFTFEIKDVTDYSNPELLNQTLSLDEYIKSNNSFNEAGEIDGENIIYRGWSHDNDDYNTNVKLLENDNDSYYNIQSNSLLQQQLIQEQLGNLPTEPNAREKALKALRKASVAVTGTALVVAGIPMIPMPTPGGVIVAGSGMALLATEFPAAQRVLDKSRDGLERMVGKDDDDDDDDSSDRNSDDDKNDKRGNCGNDQSLRISPSNGYTKIGYGMTMKSSNYRRGGYNDSNNTSNHNEEAGGLLSSKGTNEEGSVGNEGGGEGDPYYEYADDSMSLGSRSTITAEQRVEEAFYHARKAGRKTKKNLKKFVRGTILPLMNKITTPRETTTTEDDSISQSSQSTSGTGLVTSPASAATSPNSKNNMANSPPTPKINSPASSGGVNDKNKNVFQNFLRGDSIKQMVLNPINRPTTPNNSKNNTGMTISPTTSVRPLTAPTAAMSSSSTSSFPLKAPNEENEDFFENFTK